MILTQLSATSEVRYHTLMGLSQLSFTKSLSECVVSPGLRDATSSAGQSVPNREESHIKSKPGLKDYILLQGVSSPPRPLCRCLVGPTRPLHPTLPSQSTQYRTGNTKAQRVVCYLIKSVPKGSAHRHSEAVSPPPPLYYPSLLLGQRWRARRRGAKGR